MLGRRLINTGAVACTTDTVQILDALKTESLALYRFEDNVNDTSNSTGKFGKGAVFNGTNASLDIASSTLIQNNIKSFSFWFKRKFFFGFYDPSSATSSDRRRWFITNSTDGSIKIQVNNDQYNYQQTGITEDNNWHHLAVIDDGKIYLDGNLLSNTFSTSYWITDGTNGTSRDTIRMGSGDYIGSASISYVEGLMDQLRFFNKTISGSEVTTLYNETSSTVNTLQILGDTSCVAAYTFEGNAQDLSGNYYHGSASNVVYDYSGTASNVTYTTGKFGKAAVFNGSSSYIALSNNPINGQSNISISFWIKPDNVSSDQYVITFINSDGGWHGFGIRISSSAKIQVVRANSGTVTTSENSAATLSTGSWKHIVVTSSQSEVKIYIDGGLDSTHSISGFTTNNTGEYNIGALKNAGSYSQFYDGVLDQVRIFDKKLSSGEVNSLYNETATSAASATIDNPSTVAYYKMADGTDETGNYDATTVSNVDFNVQGKYGFAGNFNGSSSQIITGYAPQAGTTAATISLWINFNSYANSYAVIAGDNNSGSTHQGFLMLATGAPTNAYNSNGHLWVSLGNQNSGYDIDASTSFDSYGGIGSWIHVAVTVSGTSVSIYMNGSLVKSYTSTISYAPTASAHNYRLGYVSGWGYLDAKLDQIRFFNKAISASEVSKLYNEIQCPNTIDTPESHFNTKLFTPTTSSSALPVTGVGFTPDLIWAKYRGTGSGYASQSHYWYDTVRGINSRIFSNSNQAESTSSYVQSFDTDGITYVNNLFNRTGADSVVGWFWKAGGSAVAGSANHYINVEKSVNDEAGFSIVRFDFPYVSGGNALVPNDASYNHGLSKKPDLIITKTYNGYLGAADWYTWASPLGAGTNGLRLNDTSDGVGEGYFGTIDSTKAEYRFSSNNINGLSAVVTYNFRNIDGYQRIGSYIGNNSTFGPFVFTGFEPAWLMIKRIDSSGNSWAIFDNKRVESDGDQSVLFADTSTYESDYDLDFLANGFQIKSTTTNLNANGGKYLFWAIAANPDTTAPTKANSFKTVLYTGDDGTSRQLTGMGFKPDFTWIKQRNAVDNHALFDSVRGVNLSLSSNLVNVTNDRNDDSTKGVTSFDNDGVTLGSWNNVNANNDTYVAWNWKGLDHDRNLPAVNNDGSIASLVSANIAAGFSIVSYRGNASSGATVGHGLGGELDLLIVKSTNLTQAWNVYVKGVTDTNAKYLRLNESNGIYTTVNPRFIPGNFNNNVFSIGSDNACNGNNDDYIAYCFRSISGYSKVGVYSGSGNSQTIYVTDDGTSSGSGGFQPVWVLIKNTTANSSNWMIYDAARDTDGTLNKFLEANTSDDEASASTASITPISNGFTIGNSNSLHINDSTDDYIYMAFK